MSDKQKVEAILNLLVDQTVGKATKEIPLINKDEQFGALAFAGYVFNKAYKIAKS